MVTSMYYEEVLSQQVRVCGYDNIDDYGQEDM